MTKDNFDFLDRNTDLDADTEALETVEQVEESVSLSDATETVELGDETDAPPASTQENENNVPVAAVLDERKKRQEAQRSYDQAVARAENAEALLNEYRKNQQQSQQQPQAQNLDYYDNPEFAIRAQLYNQKIEQSRFLAEREYGADLVNEVFQYFEQNKDKSQQFAGSPSPFHAAVEYYKKEKVFSEMQADPEAYIEARVQARLAEQTQQPAARPPAPPAPPASLSKAPTTGANVSAPKSGFEQLFG
ncbi:MAG: hypothetical protein U5K75_12160 [Ahrensia sp.]|nr:hypothetical protein [Ahrensia sp.]